ncbi:5-oxoprolinase subunit PxpB [Salegentibacter sp. F188]|uniref:5-oxoprolinase subunit PxpB n=1 Tax=Autumnicola patrickiae TaxID=3075591 RepID=A0ABU3DWU8_9FLAO|nr:5-oxoprolinase subunit PxpB [Salegentibacter sp. F188]MDT0688192.1 5-oxoprolinase subunit PxpB [Salegentibacter sp. F188]
MKQDFPKIKPMGQRAILIEFEPEINEQLLQKLLSVKDLVQNFYIKEKVEVNNAYSSLLINYTTIIEDVYGELFELERLIKGAKIEKNITSKIYHLPVCYSKKSGLDLQLISEQNQVSVEEIISRHTAPFYTVYFMGFLPGFLYLGGLDEKLHISRKEQPRMKIEKGAVGIGEKQTGIYPQPSPGGWQIIGNCPVNFFDKNSLPPSRISSGDKVKFFAVSEEEFETVSREIEEGNYQLKVEDYHVEN